MSAATVAALPKLLEVQAVMDRYGLRDRRAARRIIDAAGGFRVAGRLVVRVDDLDAYERALREARRAPQAPERATTPRRPPKRRTGAPTASREPLAPGWWREAKS